MNFSSLKQITWYAVRPKQYITLFHKVLNKLTEKRHPSDEQVVAWCEAHALSTQECLEQLIGKPFTPSFSVEQAEEIQKAQARVDTCPARMGGGGDLELLYQLCNHLRARTVLETGVAYGWSSFAILSSLAKRGGTLISIDLPYPNLNAEDFVGCAIPEALKTHWMLKRGSDRSLLKKVISSGPFDLCHYDSDKSYRGRMWAYPLLWNALKPDGLFLSDDVSDNRAFKDFCEELQQEPIIIRFKQATTTKYIGCLQKPL